MPFQIHKKPHQRKMPVQISFPSSEKIQLAGQPVLQPRRKTPGPDHRKPAHPRIRLDLSKRSARNSDLAEREIRPDLTRSRRAWDSAGCEIRPNLSNPRRPRVRYGRISQDLAEREIPDPTGCEIRLNLSNPHRPSVGFRLDPIKNPMGEPVRGGRKRLPEIGDQKRGWDRGRVQDCLGCCVFSGGSGMLGFLWSGSELWWPTC
jgi:hypothetical protein